MPEPAVVVERYATAGSTVDRDGTRSRARDIICLELKARVQSLCLRDCDSQACPVRASRSSMFGGTIFFSFAKLLFGEVSSVPQKVRNVE